MTDESSDPNGPSARERSFIERIDCRFPYHDPQARLALFAEAAALSVNAEMSTLYELFVLPSSASVPLAVQRALLSEWRSESRGSRCVEFADIAVKRLDGRSAPEDIAALEALTSQMVRGHCARNILLSWFVPDDWTERDHAECEARIAAAWERSARRTNLEPDVGDRGDRREG
jgi:hypothetical protein